MLGPSKCTNQEGVQRRKTDAYILRNLVDAGQVSEHLCDPALTEYSALFDEVAVAGTTQFDHTTDRLDTYYHSLLDGKGDYEDGDRDMVVVLHDTAPPVKRIKRKQLDLPEPPSLLIQPTP